jgi:hypothetical protein
MSESAVTKVDSPITGLGHGTRAGEVIALRGSVLLVLDGGAMRGGEGC